MFDITFHKVGDVDIEASFCVFVSKESCILRQRHAIGKTYNDLVTEDIVDVNNCFGFAAIRRGGDVGLQSTNFNLLSFGSPFVQVAGNTAG